MFVSAHSILSPPTNAFKLIDPKGETEGHSSQAVEKFGQAALD